MIGQQPRTAYLLVLVALATSCSDASVDHRLPFDEQRSDIINGTTPADGSLQALGVVQISFDGGTCTGTLVSNQFVITARHCVRQWTGSAWGSPYANVRARLDSPDTLDQNITAAAVWESTGNPPNGDYALLALSQPMTFDRRTDEFYNPIYEGTDASLLNQTALCVGYGNNVYASVGPPPRRQQGAGVLRTANLVYSNTSGNVLTMVPNAAGQITTAGDSGSTCFFNNQVTGISSTGVFNPAGPNGGWVDVNGDGISTANEFTSILSALYTSPDAYRAWATPILNADVTTSFTYSPAISSSMHARLEAVTGLDIIVDAKVVTTLPAYVLRGGWVKTTITSEPPRTMCGVTRQVAPATGTAVLRGACLNDGLVSNLVSRML